ncbi:aspartate/glutamate racemase family protein [Alteromonas halophila]|uniref:Aspartate racemase n=1 Tax=Alteromonas halophila TaxID=516698 RepID=A0A918JHS3_9ALTE|nr:aspartate/glutamate racemase family protein [Alteromonas halophila]GGW76495.1 aspartate racemase [Alteromonas halophila]
MSVNAASVELRTLGLVGGMSWESTASYYALINRGIQARCGGLTSARLLLSSVNFEQVANMQRNNDWAGAAKLLSTQAQTLENAGAQAILLCTNTMHKVADELAAAVSVPLLHIADSLSAALHADARTCIGLLGTRFTMQETFYKTRLVQQGIDVIVPNPQEQDDVHRIIFEELCQGILREASRQRYLEIITRLQTEGAQAMVLGCTEIALLLDASHTDIPLYDTTALHAAAGVGFALGEG